MRKFVQDHQRLWADTIALWRKTKRLANQIKEVCGMEDPGESLPDENLRWLATGDNKPALGRNQ